MDKLLDENAPLEINDCLDCMKKSVIPEFPNFCLWPIRSYFISDKNYNKFFVCKNETFDEQGRMIVFYGDTIFCELEKLTVELFQQYKPFVTVYRDRKISFSRFYFPFFSHVDITEYQHWSIRADDIRLVHF